MIESRVIQTFPSVYVALSTGMRLTRNLDRFLDMPIVFKPRRLPNGTAAVLGWGLKGKAPQAMAYAEHHGLPYIALEDGFLRSVGLGDRDPPLSVSVDSVGVYYDARRPSALEEQIAAQHTEAQRARGRALADVWRDGRLSKYNHAREAALPVAGPYVLAVDQTVNDMSIQLGLATSASFRHMLEAALDENPRLPVLLKVHPDVIAGRKRSHFDRLCAGSASRVRLLSTQAHPPPLLEAAESVYVVTSQMGFEALVWRRPVRCFGMPFYAGWGLTKDELSAPRRRSTTLGVSLEDLVYASLVQYPRYIDPETLRRCEVELVMEWMTLQRRMRERFPTEVQAVAFSNWKKPIARAFFSGSHLRFVVTPESTTRTSADASISPKAHAFWGCAKTGDLVTTRNRASPLLRVEDGFLRSVGLGADWVRPLSWVIDRSGMYYDASAPSDLETLLETASFDRTLQARAKALRKQIVDSGITKYNIGVGTWRKPPSGRLVVLVPGQVESDASITYGAPGLHSNLALLRAVRSAVPEAHLVYKPHPDVLAQKRLRSKDEHRAREYCDEVVTDVPMHLLLSAADEVHVLTSLAGFEALLRGKRVVCYGQPFYAGWGLTEDIHPHPRRTRKLTLDELVAAALILYPTYVSRTSGAFTTPERALYELQHWHDLQPPVEARWLRMLRLLKRTRDRWRRRR